MAEGIVWKGEKAFFNKLDKLSRGYPVATDHCAAAIGVQVLHDGVNETPTVPIRTGKLRSSGTFEVFGGAHWRHTKLVVGYNTTYAAKVHQLTGIGRWRIGLGTGARFREPGSGAYFLSSKLDRHAKRYVEDWASCVSHRLGMS